MRDRLFSLRGIEPGEKYMVSMLLAQALFLGIFIGAFDISAHSLFLAIFDEKMLAKGYMASGFAGMILLSLYFFFQSRIKFRNLAVFNLIAVATITLILWISVVVSSSEWVIFLVFIMLGPLNILVILGFRGTARFIFTIVNWKRLFAILDAALIVGIIISCYAIPILLSFNFPLNNFLLISTISIIGSVLIQGMIGARSMLFGESNGIQYATLSKSISGLNVFRENKYSRILGIFIVLSVVSAFFIQYSFLAVTREKFPAGEDMARFLRIFTGSIMILTLLGKLLLFSYLLKNYGLRICLIISPVLLATFTAIAVAFGMIMGYTMETASGFIIFFILLGLIRVLSKSMEESIESPSYKLLYQTIDEKLRFGVQSVMDSSIKEAAAFLAGLTLAGVGVLSFIKLIHFSWILFIILIVWLFVAFRLYSEYRKSIRVGLELLKSEDTTSAVPNEPTTLRNRFYGERAFRIDYINLISGDFSLFEKINNRFYFKKIIDNVISKQDVNLLPLIKKIPSRNIDVDIRQQATEVVKDMEKLSSGRKNEDEWIGSARRVMSEARMPQTTEILRLLRDKSLESKRHAIYLIGKFRLSDMIPELCECLNIQGLETETATILSAFGNSAEEELIRFYLVSSGNISTSKTILRLLAKLSLNEGTGFLFSRLWSNSRQLKEVALQCLIDCRFRPSEEDKERLNLLTSDIVGLMVWNLSAKRCLEKNNDTILLKEMNKELNRWSRFLINILSITYDAAAVTRIRKNLEFETVESVHYAHAIIDIMVDDSIKAEIIYLLDVVPDDQKLKNLNRFFPVEIPHYDKLLEDILNRDYNLLSLWTKACVLKYLSGINDTDMSESVVALLFSPESILQEEAARLIARSDLKLYRSVSNRIPLATRKHLDRIIDGETDANEFLFEKIQFLSDCFEVIIEEELLFLARNMIFIRDTKTIMTSSADGYILWTLTSGSNIPAVRIYYSDNVEKWNENLSSADTSFYILSLKTIEEFLYQFPDNTNTILTFIEKNER